jgi:hypothetical protein
MFILKSITAREGDHHDSLRSTGIPQESKGRGREEQEREAIFP